MRTGIFDNYSHMAVRVASGRQRNISGQSLAVRPMREKIEQLDLRTDAIANGFLNCEPKSSTLPYSSARQSKHLKEEITWAAQRE
jgi:hypothetical protein